MRKAQFFYLLRRGLLSGGLNLIKEGLVMASKFTTQGLSFPAQGSAEFNGTSDYIDTGIDIDTTQPMTFGAWVYLDNNSTARAIIGDGYPSANEAAFSLITIQSSSNLFISYGSSSINAANLLPSLNQWFYLSVTFDSGNINAFINGSKLYNGSYNNAYPQHNRSQFLGARRSQSSPYDAIQFLDGNLANVAIWNRALTSDEINSVMWKSYEGLTGAESNGLQAWYSLDDITSPAASLANMEQLATDKDATIENKAAITAAINSLS